MPLFSLIHTGWVLSTQFLIHNCQLLKKSFHKGASCDKDGVTPVLLWNWQHVPVKLFLQVGGCHISLGTIWRIIEIVWHCSFFNSPKFPRFLVWWTSVNSFETLSLSEIIPREILEQTMKITKTVKEESVTSSCRNGLCQRTKRLVHSALVLWEGQCCHSFLSP